MLTEIHPKIPMRNKHITKEYYINKLGFQQIGIDNFEEYLMIKKYKIAIHPNGSLQKKPWKQREFTLLDPDNSLITFGQGI